MGAVIRAGDLFAGRYRMTVLLAETGGGRFWRARDEVLARSVALHLIDRTDERAEMLMEAARHSARVQDRRLLRVLDAEAGDTFCYVVNEWGDGISLDRMLADSGPLAPRKAAWLAAEVADSLATAHAAGEAHGLLNPENILIDRHGQVRIIGFAVEAALRGLPPGRVSADVTDAVALLYAALTGRWAGISRSEVPSAPHEHGGVLRARQVRAGIPRALDTLCDGVLGVHAQSNEVPTARALADLLGRFVGDAGDLSDTTHERPHPVALAAPQLMAAAPEPAPEVATQTHLPPVPVDADATEALDLSELRHSSDEDPALTDLTWLEPRTDAPPAPDLPTPDARPLFAPDPRPGEAGRENRHLDTSEPVTPPWQQEPAAPVDDESWRTEDAVDGEVPGRTWFRLAVLVGVLALVLLTAVAIKQVTGGTKSTPDPNQVQDSHHTGALEPTPVQTLTAFDLDPQSDTREENPELAPLSVDGDPTTFWQTVQYLQEFGPGGLKSGVGLVVDLGEVHTVAQVDVKVLGGETTAELFVTKDRPRDVKGLELQGRQSALERLSFVPSPRPEGRYVIVWLTSLPAVDGGFRGRIAEIKVLAEP